MEPGIDPNLFYRSLPPRLSIWWAALIPTTVWGLIWLIGFVLGD